jgi:hypothetical protein
LRAITPFVVLALVLGFGCRSKPKPDAPAVSGSQAAREPVPLRCREASGAEVVVLGSGEPPKPAGEDDEEVEELPYSVELGSARASGQRFAVAGLENRRGATFAFAAFVAADGTGRSTELLRVFGDSEPPELAPSDEGWLVLAASSDAGSATLRLMRVDPPFSERDVRRGEELTGLRRDVSGFAIETLGGRALAAFGKLEKKQGRIALAAIDPQKLALVAPAQLLELEAGLEGESPKLAARTGGYYLAFVGRRAAPAPKPKPALANTGGEANAEEPVVDAGPTGLFLVPLDEAGAPQGAPRELSPPGAHVTAFELARWGESQALLVYRDDPEGPGRDRPSVEAVLVSLDGSVGRRTWELADSSGLPSFFVDPAPQPGMPPGWLVVHGDNDTRLGALSSDPLASPVLVADPTLGNTEPAALLGGRLLRARSRGTRVELDLVSCEPGRP